MRLREIDRGDSIASRLLIRFISLVSGMRLPDAARVAFYHKDFFSAPMGEWTQAAMEFLEVMTLRPTELTPNHAEAVLRAGVGAQALKDAIAVGAVFNIVTRYANALDFAVPAADEFDRAASMLLKRGYRS